MARPPVCEECGRAAAVQVQGPVALCRRCAGLLGPGVLNWRQVHERWSCVVCGQRSVASVLSGEGLERPVCHDHVMAAPWQIDLLLAVQATKAAIALAFQPLTQRIISVLLRLARWLEGDEE